MGIGEVKDSLEEVKNLIGQKGVNSAQFLSDAKFWVTLILVIPAWGIIWCYPQNQALTILGTNVITGVMGYWIGSSISSSDKNKMLLQSPPVPQGGTNEVK